MARDADLDFHLSKAIEAHAPRSQLELETARRHNRATVLHTLARLMKVRRQQTRDSGHGLVEALAVGVKQGQFERAARGVALAGSIIARNGSQMQALGQCRRVRKIGARLHLQAQISALQEGKIRVNRFPGNIIARHALAKTLCSVVENAADKDVIGLATAVRRVLNLFAQRDADFVGRDLDNFHAGTPPYGLGKIMPFRSGTVYGWPLRGASPPWTAS